MSRRLLYYECDPLDELIILGVKIQEVVVFVLNGEIS